MAHTCLRVSETRRGAPVYTPRLVSCGLNGSLGAVPSHGTLTDPSSSSSSSSSSAPQWGSGVDIFRQPSIPKSAFQLQLDGGGDADGAGDGGGDGGDDGGGGVGLEGQVRYWTDYAKVHLHARNVVMLDEIHHGVNEFDTFSHGYERVQQRGTLDTICDRVRYMVEECDRMQGFQCLVDADSGFAGVCARVLEDINDDYEGVPLVVCPCTPDTDEYAQHAHPSVRRMVRDVNSALCMSQLGSLATWYAPLSSRGWRADAFGDAHTIDTQQWFHTAAYLGAAFHTLSLPYRQRRQQQQQTQVSVRDMSNVLCMTPATNMVAMRMQCALPDTSMPLDAVCARHMHNQGGDDMPVYRASYMTDVSGWATRHQHGFDFERTGGLTTEWTVMRGAERLRWPELDRVAAGYQVPVDTVSRYNPVLSFLASEPVERRDATYIDHPLPLPLPFPDTTRGGGDEWPVFAEAHTAVYIHGAVDECATAAARAMRYPVVVSQFDKYDMLRVHVDECIEALTYTSQRYKENAR